MSKVFRYGVLFTFLGILFVSNTGCARKKSTNKTAALEAQMGVITDEIVRLDQSIQEIRASMQAQGGGVAAVSKATSATSGAGVYRTPSGFELPSINIQKALQNAGYYQGKVDGKVGPSTRDAVKAFQRDHSLEADGVVGRRTWDKMKVYLVATAAK